MVNGSVNMDSGSKRRRSRPQEWLVMIDILQRRYCRSAKAYNALPAFTVTY